MISPTKPGWWWADFYGGGNLEVIEVVGRGGKIFAFATGDECEVEVGEVSRWICEVPVPERVKALRAVVLAVADACGRAEDGQDSFDVADAFRDACSQIDGLLGVRRGAPSTEWTQTRVALRALAGVKP